MIELVHDEHVAGTRHADADENMRIEASRQIGRDVAIERVHISLIRGCDTVFHEGVARTVCQKDIRHDAFMGRTMFGDSYVLGRKPVLRIVMPRAA